jgi:hypothetical protein
MLFCKLQLSIGDRLVLEFGDSEHATMMINGVVMNKIYDGRPQWGEWGGLNDALRNQEFTLGTAPSDYTFGVFRNTRNQHTSFYL